MKAALALIVLLALAGPAQAASLSGTLRYERSGGIAGLSDDMTLRKDGRATFRTDTKTLTVRLKKTERERVARLVRDADLARVKIKRAIAYPDSFSYRLSYRGTKLAFTDANFPPRLNKLVDELAKLVDKYVRPR